MSVNDSRFPKEGAPHHLLLGRRPLADATKRLDVDMTMSATITAWLRTGLDQPGTSKTHNHNNTNI